MTDPEQAPPDPMDWREAECEAVRSRPAARAWDEAAVGVAVDEADQEARDCLDALWEKYGRRQPEEYLKDFGLKVVPVGFSDRWPRPYFAMYDSGDMAIEVNLRLIRDVGRYLRDNGRADWVADDRMRQVAIAHELFHHLVFLRGSSGDAAESKRHVSLRERWRRRTASARDAARREIVEEIAAVRFSQLMNTLDYSPLEYTRAAGELPVPEINDEGARPLFQRLVRPKDPDDFL